MTRPAGTTPGRGFPYPGSELIIANIPGAMKALADAISANLTGIGQGVVLAFHRGSHSVSAGIVTWDQAAAFPTLAVVQGMIATQDTGGPAASVLGGGLNGARMNLYPLQHSLAKFSGSVTIDAIAWGTPK